MQSKDYFKILGVSRNASADEIKKKFRQLASEFHPDRHQEDDEYDDSYFREILEAYNVLSNEELKQKFLESDTKFNYTVLAKKYNLKKPIPPDIYRTTYVDITSAFCGSEKQLEYYQKSMCDDCSGSGYGEGDVCGNCSGVGKVKNKYGESDFLSICPSCAGNKIKRSLCQSCGGKGFKSELKNISFKLPKYCTKGATLKITGKGNYSEGLRGDLFVKIKYKDNPSLSFEDKQFTLLHDAPLEELFNPNDREVKIGSETFNVQLTPRELEYPVALKNDKQLLIKVVIQNISNNISDQHLNKIREVFNEQEQKMQ